MKLGQLKSAIRASKDNPPTVFVRLTAGGPELRLLLQKTALLEELDRAYPGGKAVETGLAFDDSTGTLRSADESNPSRFDASKELSKKVAQGIADALYVDLSSDESTTTVEHYTPGDKNPTVFEVPLGGITFDGDALSDIDLLSDMPAAPTSLDDLLV